MATLYKRLCIAAILSLLSIITLIMLLPRAHIDRLQTITLGGKLDMDGIWKWVDGKKEEEEGAGVRMVVFGDSWVSSDGKLGDGKMESKTWVDVLCEEMNCTSQLNLAASQASTILPSTKLAADAVFPTGAATSNKIHTSALAADQSTPFIGNQTAPLLPDLATQIQSFLSKPLPAIQPHRTIFVLSFGFWDIYSFVFLDAAGAQSATVSSIDEIFAQLDLLYSYFAQTLYPPATATELENKTMENSNMTIQHPHPNFQIIIPRVFDPTMMPGWLSERPIPLKPSSVAEQQKNAVYLTERWNSLVENRMGAWLETAPSPVLVPKPTEAAKKGDKVEVKAKTGASRTDVRHPESSDTSSRADNTAREEEEEEMKVYPQKEVFYYDLPSFLLSEIVNHNLQREDISDALGLGTEESPYLSVYEPCVQEGWVGKGAREAEELEGFEEKGGLLVCRDQEKFLFWDAWNLGVRAKREVGRSIAKMVKEGKALKMRQGH